MRMAATRTARTLAPAAAKRAASRPTTTERRIVEGRVTEVLPDGRAKLVTSAGLTIACRCPQHINVDWLRAAVAVAPVEAEALDDRPRRDPLVPPAGALSTADGWRRATLDLVAKDTLKIACGGATVSLDKTGTIRVRGSDVTTRGSRVARLQGGTVRIN